MLDDGRWDYDDSAADCARSVIDLHRQVDTARTVAANVERERHALREAYDRDVARLAAERNAALAARGEQSAGDGDLIRRLFAEVNEYIERVEARDAAAERLTAELSTATGEIARLRASLAEVSHG